MKEYVLARLREPSTWRGIILLLSAAGATLTPEQAEAIITVGLALAGAVAVFVPDAIKP